MKNDGCQGKKGHPTQQAAWRIIYQQWAKPRPGKKPVRPYKCPHCHKWHTTSRPAKGKT